MSPKTFNIIMWSLAVISAIILVKLWHDVAVFEGWIQ